MTLGDGDILRHHGIMHRSIARPRRTVAWLVACVVTFAFPVARAELPPGLIGSERYRLPTTRPVVALTFDAGSNGDGVRSILATLRARDARATFFLTGRFARSFPNRSQRMAHYPIGNHTDTHPHLPDLPDVEIRRELNRAQRSIVSVTGRDPHPLFRFPYGDGSDRALRIANELGYASMRWSVDSLGWLGRDGGRTRASTVARVLDALAPGAIILMHVGSAPDGSMLDAAALPEILDGIEARGYRTTVLSAWV